MSVKPFFSIVIPTYNRADKLKVALRQLLVQDFNNFEIVVSDNCSTDDTRKVVDSFKSSKIRYFRNNINLDVIPNIRKAIKLSKGEYVFLHGDDDFLLKKNVLSKVFRIIQKTNVGYVRLNYLSISPDNNHIFDFSLGKGFTKNASLKHGEKSFSVVKFLLKTDCYFLTGIIFRNKFTENIEMLNSELSAWFPLIFYAARNFGALYINKYSIITGWSTWRVKKDNYNPLYSLNKGKLTSEEFLNFIKLQIGPRYYYKFLYEQLLKTYVKMFPAVKCYTGNSNVLSLAKRIISLYPSFKYDIIFWFNFILAFSIPRVILFPIKRFYFSMYVIKFSANKNYYIKVKKIMNYDK